MLFRHRSSSLSASTSLARVNRWSSLRSHSTFTRGSTLASSSFRVLKSDVTASSCTASFPSNSHHNVRFTSSSSSSTSTTSVPPLGGQKTTYASNPERKHGRVSKWFPKYGYGFIDTADGAQYYIHKDALNGKQLSVGLKVEFNVVVVGKKARAANITLEAGGDLPDEKVSVGVKEGDKPMMASRDRSDSSRSQSSRGFTRQRGSSHAQPSVYSPHPAWNFVDQRGIGGAPLMADGDANSWATNSMSVRPLSEEDLSVDGTSIGATNPSSNHSSNVGTGVPPTTPAPDLELQLFDLDEEAEIFSMPPRRPYAEVLEEQEAAAASRSAE